MNNYTAMTIGPIIKTFSTTRKSRELCGASYMFSYIMRKIIDEIGDKSKLCLPFHNEMNTLYKGLGAGLFPDRLIYEGDIKSTIDGFGNKIIKEIADGSGLPEDYLRNYIRIDSVVYSLPLPVFSKINSTKSDDEIEKSNRNIVMVGNKLLDSIELKEKYCQEITHIDWRKAIDKLNGQLFYPAAFSKKQGDNFCFPSLIEIATDDFSQIKEYENEYKGLVKELNSKTDNKQKQDEKQDEQDVFIQSLKQLGLSPSKPERLKSFQFRNYHQYVAVVQSDGDDIGQTIASIGNDPEKIRHFSTALFDFSVEATKAIKAYGGKGVYAGGDDLLFFAPVAVWTDKDKDNQTQPYFRTVFTLIKQIDDIFEQKVVKNVNLNNLYQGKIKPPTMSYGVSINYYKFPLNEAKDNALSLLWKIKNEITDKNKINYKLRKHSGQTFGFKIDKKQINGSPNKSFGYFMELTSKIPLEKDLLASVIYKLKPMYPLLKAIADDNDRLTAFFTQEFDLDSKKEKDMSATEKLVNEYILTIKDYFHQLSVDYCNDNNDLPGIETEEDTTNIGKLYSALRFLKFVTDESDE